MKKWVNDVLKEKIPLDTMKMYRQSPAPQQPPTNENTEETAGTKKEEL